MNDVNEAANQEAVDTEQPATVADQYHESEDMQVDQSPADEENNDGPNVEAFEAPQPKPWLCPIGLAISRGKLPETDDAPEQPNPNHFIFLASNGQAVEELRFQTGPVQDNIPNGVSLEALLKVVETRIDTLNSNPGFHSPYNDFAALLVEASRESLTMRANDRKAAGTFGTETPDELTSETAAGKIIDNEVIRLHRAANILGLFRSLALEVSNLLTPPQEFMQLTQPDARELLAGLEDKVANYHKQAAQFNTAMEGIMSTGIGMAIAQVAVDTYEQRRLAAEEQARQATTADQEQLAEQATQDQIKPLEQTESFASSTDETNISEQINGFSNPNGEQVEGEAPYQAGRGQMQNIQIVDESPFVNDSSSSQDTSSSSSGSSDYSSGSSSAGTSD